MPGNDILGSIAPANNVLGAITPENNILKHNHSGKRLFWPNHAGKQRLGPITPKKTFRPTYAENGRFRCKDANRRRQGYLGSKTAGIDVLGPITRQTTLKETSFSLNYMGKYDIRK